MDKKYVVIYGDGIHDDTAALQAIANGAKGITPSGVPIEKANITCLINKSLVVKSNKSMHSTKLRPEPEPTEN